MRKRILSIVAIVALASLAGASPSAQRRLGAPEPLQPGQTDDPFPQPIARDQGVITVTLREFASLPDIDGVPARMMMLVQEPTSRRIFVSDMRGPLYTISDDGKTVTPYLDLRDPKWAIAVQSEGRERGMQSFVLHPEFAQAGAPGFGKFYTYTDSSNQVPAPDFTTPHPATTHDTVLHEWTAKTPGAAAYDGAAPREVIRLRQPFPNHNGGMITFNPTARPGAADYGLLYMGIADGGSGGDPMKLAQNLGAAFGKLFRIDPLGKNGRGGKYGVPASNPFASTPDALPEIYAYGIRNSQRFSWDAKSGAMYLTDIGQGVVEEVSPVTAGANLGWSVWEGSFRFVRHQVISTDTPRSDPKVTYPIVEWGQLDPVLLANNSSAAVGLVVYRSTTIPQLTNRILFGDMPSGEMFHVSADDVPKGGQDPIRRVLFVTGAGAAARPFLAIVQEKNRAQGKGVAQRADMRFDVIPDGRIFALNKADGTIRVIEN
ncbi:Soluble aldose sugar dehydrogenase YliI precursor [Luteitalea pratensis]|uniref:Soluble aldose sugar dehydrogenase YliI n=1 Tax=Luteitalea pratensis TaxID=1855912 RepID=A0A143PUU2_LUTPR|nr:PQQ-dependent sugar dehydrogenase [Luteitalea pratensis]AMY11958.1 Soluble aldose sugar dehydrogenase YliI precursor [Luteitalea pratensis]